MVYFTPPDKNDSFTRIILDGREYLLRFSYNYKGGFWTFGVYANESTPVVAGIKIVPCFTLNNYFTEVVKMPRGVFGVITTRDKVGRNDFVDGTAEFIFATLEEVEEIKKEAINV